MRIGILADQVGVNAKTIRFYEDKGLLRAPSRLASGYRDYGPEDESRLVFIKTAQRLGFTLAEITEILALKEDGVRPCNYVLSVFDARLGDIDRQLVQLVSLKAELLALKSQVDNLDQDDACYCTIIEHAKPLANVHQRVSPEGD